MVQLFNCYLRTCSDAECTEIKGIGDIKTHAGGAIQFDDNCNPHACPSNMMAKSNSLGNAQIGEWTSWECNKECFNSWYEYQNGRNNKLSRSRSRTCKEFPYFNGYHSVKHPDPNHQCENIIQSQSERGCHHQSLTWCKYTNIHV